LEILKFLRKIVSDVAKKIKRKFEQAQLKEILTSEPSYWVMGICGDVWDFSLTKLDFEFEKLRMKWKSKICEIRNYGLRAAFWHQFGEFMGLICWKVLGGQGG